MTELHLESVSKRYGTGEAATAALEDVDLHVRDGEFFTLVGPSGCGKTTTLRTIAGFEPPTSGTVRFDDEPMDGVEPEHRDIGVVFQSYALFPHMTVAENVGYGLRFREPPSGTSATERVAELLELVDLAGMGERDPTTLSGGQRQRVALARALAPEPDVLLLDEPMSALDARLRETLRRQLKRIQNDLGITTIYVTHDQEEALAVSDRVAVISDGRVEQVGTPEAVYRTPETRFVAEFIGDNNVFEGRILETDGDSVRVEIGDRTFRVADPRDRTERPIRHDGGEDRIVVCVRPEQLSTEITTNSFPVEIETSEFLGTHVRVQGTWNDSPVVLSLAEEPRETTTVGFSPSDARIVAPRSKQ